MVLAYPSPEPLKPEELAHPSLVLAEAGVAVGGEAEAAGVAVVVVVVMVAAAEVAEVPLLLVPDPHLEALLVVTSHSQSILPWLLPLQ